MRRPASATIADVAARAGVSTSTVSRALNGRGYVAAAVKLRVAAAAKALGYVPDINARNLRAGTRMDVGVLISDLRNPFYAELATGMEGRLREAGYHMLLVNDDGDPEEEMAAVMTFAALRVPGVIITPVAEGAVAHLVQHGVHVVQADRVVDGTGADAVVSANEAGARMATAHLTGLGHRRIAMMIDESSWTTGAGRLAGYRAAHRDAGLPVDEALVVHTGMALVDMWHLMTRVLVAQPPVTAIVAANNLLAQAVFHELQDRSIALPDQMSLVAYDDVPWMTLVRPAVTAVTQHAEELGRRSAELLISRLRGAADRGSAVRLLVNPTLLIRASTGPPPR